MAEFVVKKKKKLERVEIIPSYKIEDLKELIYNPFSFDENNLAIEDENNIDESNINNPAEIQQTFSREFKFTNLRKTQQIDLRRVPPVAILKEQHDKEIQEAFNNGWDSCLNQIQPKFNAEIDELKDWIKNFDLISNELNNQFSFELKKFEDTVLNMSIMIAQHIITKEISSHSSSVIEQVRKAIYAIEEDKIFKIRLNPNNVEILEKVKSSLFEDKSKSDGISIIADDSVDYGGCILETSSGIVDARIKTQLGRIEAQIFNSGISDLLIDDNSEIYSEGTDNEENLVKQDIISESDLNNESTENNDYLINDNSDFIIGDDDFLGEFDEFDLGEKDD